MDKFEIGMVVRLKSGSPLMTVCKRVDSGSFECIWFDSNNSPNTITLPKGVLCKVEKTILIHVSTAYVHEPIEYEDGSESCRISFSTSGLDHDLHAISCQIHNHDGEEMLDTLHKKGIQYLFLKPSEVRYEEIQDDYTGEERIVAHCGSHVLLEEMRYLDSGGGIWFSDYPRSDGDPSEYCGNIEDYQYAGLYGEEAVIAYHNTH